MDKEGQMHRTSVVASMVMLTAVFVGAQQPQPAGRGGRGGAAPAGGGRQGRQGGAAPAGEPNEGRAQPGPSLKIERDLEYGRAAGQRLTLDLYRMDPAATPIPLVVWIHGSEPPLNTKIATPAIALVSNSGYAAASVEYRSGAAVTRAMQLADVKAAIRWLRANAATYNLDGAHIAAFGYGVGGQLAALAATTADEKSLEGDAGPLDQTSRVQAAVDLAGPVTTGGLNPVTYVTKASAPILMLHGTADNVVSTQESQKLVSALKVAGVATTLDLQVGVGHDVGALLSPTAMQTIGTFLNQQLKGAGGGGGLSSFVATPSGNYIDPVALDLGGTLYRLYETPARAAGTFASYRVYLPPDYQANAARRYPVIYFLHGASVDSKRPITSGYIARVDAAIRSGTMPPVIVILAEAPNQNRWMDSRDGKDPIETMIVKDLIPHVDKTYRTIATRAGRAIEGHSMGGFGALHNGFSHPELFIAVTGNSPCCSTIDDASATSPSSAVYSGDRNYFIAMAPSTLAVKNASLVRQQRIRIICGTKDALFAGATFVHEELMKANIAHEFIPVPESPHNHDQLLQFETFDTMAFYATVFGRAK